MESDVTLENIPLLKEDINLLRKYNRPISKIVQKIVHDKMISISGNNIINQLPYPIFIAKPSAFLPKPRYRAFEDPLSYPFFQGPPRALNKKEN
jgi:hypothetical protein